MAEATEERPGLGGATLEEPKEVTNILIQISNVLCTFNVRCPLDLRRIALTAKNVNYLKQQGVVIMKLRKPMSSASIFASGKVTMTGCTSEAEAKVAARRCARIIQKIGFKSSFGNFRVVSVLAHCSMPFAIKIPEFFAADPIHTSYESELHAGCTHKLTDLAATLIIFSTGSITVIAKSVDSVQQAVVRAYHLLVDFQIQRIHDNLQNYPFRERMKIKRDLRKLQKQDKKTKRKAAYAIRRAKKTALQLQQSEKNSKKESA